MANPEHLEILKQGVGVWNEWREVEPYLKPDLSGPDRPAFTPLPVESAPS